MNIGVSFVIYSKPLSMTSEFTLIQFNDLWKVPKIRGLVVRGSNYVIRRLELAVLPPSDLWEGRGTGG